MWGQARYVPFPVHFVLSLSIFISHLLSLSLSLSPCPSALFALIRNGVGLPTEAYLKFQNRVSGYKRRKAHESSKEKFSEAAVRGKTEQASRTSHNDLTTTGAFSSHCFSVTFQLKFACPLLRASTCELVNTKARHASWTHAPSTSPSSISDVRSSQPPDVQADAAKREGSTSGAATGREDPPAPWPMSPRH